MDESKETAVFRKEFPTKTAGSRSELGVPISPQQITQYLESVKGKGRTAGSLQKYHRDLTALYDYLPPVKRIGPDTLREWRVDLIQQGYATRTVNTFIVEANGFLRWLGAWQCLLTEQIELQNDVQPELTRNEYIRLLSVARALDKERTYLLVKTFACVGVTVQELPKLTVEALDRGYLAVPASGGKQNLYIPDCLRGELQDYARRKCIAKGPIFVTRTGKPIRRTAVAAMIQVLSHDARVAPEKCNTRCLRKLYLATQKSIQANLAMLMEQSYNRMLEAEQLIVGWAEVNHDAT